MNVQIRSKEITLTPHLNDHIATAIENFRRYHLDITTVNVLISKEKQKLGVNVEFDIHVAHAQPIVISDNDQNIDTAIDLAIDRANKALGRVHDKMKDHHATSLREIEVAETEASE